MAVNPQGPGAPGTPPPGGGGGGFTQGAVRAGAVGEGGGGRGPAIGKPGRPFARPDEQ